MRPAFQIVCAVLLAGSAFAQTILLSNSATCFAAATIAGTGQANTLPAGPMPGVGSLEATAQPSATARLDWRTSASPVSMEAWILLSATANGLAGTSSASLPGVDLLLHLSNPTVRSTFVEFDQVTSATAGSGMPLVRVDVGNNGSEELTEWMQGQTVTVPIQIGPQPLQIRIRGAMQVSGVAQALTTLRIRCRPADGLVSQFTAECGGPGYGVSPTFGGELLASAGAPVIAPVFAVFGFGVSPVGIPGLGSQFCLLVPRPDVVFLMYPWQPYVLQVPPALRPITFFTEAVGYGGIGLGTSATSMVYLY